MKLRLQYTAQLRTAVGKSEEELELPKGSSLADLLMLAAERNREARAHLFTSAGAAQPSLLIIVNGAAVPSREAASAALKCGDVVTLLPPIAGG